MAHNIGMFCGEVNRKMVGHLQGDNVGSIGPEKEKGERRKEKGERRKEKGERRKEKGERRKAPCSLFLVPGL